MTVVVLLLPPFRSVCLNNNGGELPRIFNIIQEVLSCVVQNNEIEDFRFVCTVKDVTPLTVETEQKKKMSDLFVPFFLFFHFFMNIFYIIILLILYILF
jgi:hypothetical protein